MWRGKTKMKKLIILITAMFIILLTSACGKVENTESSVVITDADAKYGILHQLPNRRLLWMRLLS